MDKKAWFLLRFTDYVLEQNSDRWRDSEPFLTTGELKATWAAFFGAKPKSQPSQQKSKKEPAAAKKGHKVHEQRASLGICWSWNLGLCVKAPGTCKSSKGKELKHICDHVLDPAKPMEVCGKDHIRKNFH